MRIANHVRTNGRLWLVALIPLLAGWGSLPGVAVETPEPLTRIEDVRRLSREEAEKSIPARITGVIVFVQIGFKPSPFFSVPANFPTSTLLDKNASRRGAKTQIK